MTKRIAHITDIHLADSTSAKTGTNPESNLKLILENVALRDIDEIIFGGDIGETEAYEWFFDISKNFPYNFQLTLGNHDTFSEVLKYYKNSLFQRNNELYYSYEDEYYKYILLDSSANKISAAQLQWLLKELLTQKKVVIFMHHPVTAVDTEADKQYPLKGREKIKAALSRHKGEITIFCGHYHMVDERTDGNIKQFITPAASFQIVKKTGKIELDSTTFGYRIINIAKDAITTEVIMNKHEVFSVIA